MTIPQKVFSEGGGEVDFPPPQLGRSAGFPFNQHKLISLQSDTFFESLFSHVFVSIFVTMFRKQCPKVHNDNSIKLYFKHKIIFGINKLYS